ncbi:histidinol-phosphate transaminase [Calidifontibacillus erzurumensis]|uniref:Histidinol-phosphate aminotransferase n=1 Tax=Calidifontibacillus erzurumensis TaxID=2741433 RepID=A0A8J8GFC2_9BACI|nr:histidinol-phosphate transaminase [Calidifontibacillus erzurumensis]NSL52287.1 histidinol-phosphate transaminase [Calidifontibacillus erzurumensis]
MKVKDQLIGLTPYQPGKPIEEVQRELGLEKIVKLASNENPFGCSEKAKEAIKESLDELALYPDGYARNIREKLANFLGVKENQLIFGNGSDELIDILCTALLSPSKNTVMAHPSFSQYSHNAIIQGAELRMVDNINGEHDLEGMLNAIDDQTAIVWVCSPNNPTGTYINEEKLINFIKRVPEHVLIVIDEAYKEYVVAEDYPDTISLLNEYPNLLVLRTFSKAYGLAALRVGYGIGHPNLIQALDPARGPFNTSRIAQAAVCAAVDDQEFIQKCVKANREGLEQFYQFCEEYGLSYFPSQANFILIDFKRSGQEVFDYLLHKGFIVRSGTALGYPTAVRITVGSYEQNAELIETLKEMLSVN